jgi:hypothetical protein
MNLSPDVILRLRKLEEQVRTKTQEAGKCAGRDWACGLTELNEEEFLALERMAEFTELFDTEDGTDAYTASERLFFEMFPEDDGDRNASSVFWEIVAQDPYPRAHFLKGFIEGAVEVYEAFREAE